jgi:hypothetical protein
LLDFLVVSDDLRLPDRGGCQCRGDFLREIRTPRIFS